MSSFAFTCATNVHSSIQFSDQHMLQLLGHCVHINKSVYFSFLKLVFYFFVLCLYSIIFNIVHNKLDLDLELELEPAENY